MAEKRKSIIIVTCLFVILAAILMTMAANARHDDGIICLLYNKATLTDVKPARLSESDSEYIMAQLTRRAAGDCVLTPTSYGWRCEDSMGRVYKIARK